MYASDFDENLPRSYYYYPPGFPMSLCVWPHFTHPYVKNWQIYSCPSAGGERTSITYSAYYLSAPLSPSAKLDYGYNRRLWGASMAQVIYPSQTILIADSKRANETTSYNGSNSWELYDTWHVSRFVPARHNGGANIGYVDGHAKWMRMMETVRNDGTDYDCTMEIGPAQGVYWYPDAHN